MVKFNFNKFFFYAHNLMKNKQKEKKSENKAEGVMNA